MEEEFACQDYLKAKEIRSAYEICKRTNLDNMPYVISFFAQKNQYKII